MGSWRRHVHSTGGYLGFIDDDPPAGASVCVSPLPSSLLLMHFNLSHCQFPSTDSPTFLPFFFFFSCADKCGGNIEIHTADYLTSPGYPGAYPPSQQCVWVITAPEPGQKILINFNPHFDLEDRDCK